MPPSEPTPADQVLIAVPTREALDAAHLQAMRGMSDHIAMLGRSVEVVAKDLRETRDGVLYLKAQDLKALIDANRAETLALIAANRVELLALIAANRVERKTEIGAVDEKADANAQAISRIQGIFLPLGMIGAAALAFLGELAANLAGHH